MTYTPENITSLVELDAIFVFGSNIYGQHGSGAARYAMDHFGAQWGVGEGLTGQCYAIPTMHGGVREIAPHVNRFIDYAIAHRSKIFYVTKIGCGKAGFSINEIAQLFVRAINIENITLPEEFVCEINKCLKNNCMKIINIGRSSHNDIVVNDNLVTRNAHCQIIQDDRGGFRVIDLNSTNGTYVNGVRIGGERILNKTDIIRIGNSTLPWQSYFSQPIVDSSPIPPYPNNPVVTPTKPDNFLVWAILATIFCNFIFGIISIVYASKVDSRWAQGDYTGAEVAAQSARMWFWISFVCGIITVAIIII